MRIYGSEPGEQKREQTRAKVGMGAEMWQQQTVWLTPYGGHDAVYLLLLLGNAPCWLCFRPQNLLLHASREICLLTVLSPYPFFSSFYKTVFFHNRSSQQTSLQEFTSALQKTVLAFSKDKGQKRAGIDQDFFCPCPGVAKIPVHPFSK